MSFGASPSDIIIVVTFARRLYRQCRNAGGEYLEISREVRGLHTVLKHLKYEVEADGSVLNRDKSLYARELAPVIGDCDFTLRELDEVLQKYGRLASRDGSGAGRLWDKIRFGSNEMDDLGSIRMKLINHKTTITMFLDTVQLHESGRMSLVLDNQNGQLDMILDKVDNIAARMSQRAGSIMTTYDDDDKEVWKQFRRELIEEGFSSDVLQQHKDVLRAYIREMDQNGVLVDEIPEPNSASSSCVNPERWLEGIPAPTKSTQSEQLPPAFASLHLNSEDTTAKERVISEDGMKFPVSIKSERAKPETGPSSQSSSPTIGDVKWQVTTREDSVAQQNEGKAGPSSLLPKLATTLVDPKPLMIAYPASIMSTTDLILRSDYRFDDPMTDRRPGSPSEEHEMQYTSSSSPIEPRNSSSSVDERVPRSMTSKPKTTLAPEPPQFGASPSQYGTSPASSRSAYGSSPRSSILEPDSKGNPIPLDAQWTKVKRELISTEVLDQDKRRYEARPDFVAVLGVLSREEIADYAARSAAIREARRARQAPPRMPPRPVDEPRRRHVSFDSASDRNHSPEYSDDEERRTSPARERRSYPSPNPPFHPGPSNYAGSPHTRERYFQPLPQFQPSPQQRGTPQFAGPASQYPIPSPYSIPPGHGHGTSAPMWIPPAAGSPQPYHLTPVEGTPTSRSPKGGSGSRVRDMSKELEREKKKRWTSNLTAAGIGGAAVSLLSVLSEAAENL